MTAPRTEPEQPALGRLNDVIGYQLRVAQMRVYGEFPAAGEMEGITPTLFTIVLLLEANPGLKQSALAAMLQVDPSTVVRLIDRLELRGLVQRSASPRDRRVAAPTLTARGLAFASAAVEAVQRSETDVVFARLSDQERSTLFALLRKANAAT
jgi:DNA-binding MarR family transcriptional regulator